MAATRSSREFEDFFNEFKDIEQGQGQQDSEEDDGHKTPDEGEQELTWLKAAGFKLLVSTFEDGKELEDDFLSQQTSSLTRAQAAAVKKRVDTLNATLRKRQYNYADVRDMFNKDSNSQKDVPNDKPVRKLSGKKLSFRRANYPMTGSAENIQDNTTTEGVETLSIQTNSRPNKLTREISREKISPLPTVSDSEITLSFELEGRNSPKPTTNGKKVEDTKDLEEDDLPNFVLVEDKLGVTKIDDLSLADMNRVRSLALIELTALFDIYNIQMSRRKSKKKLKDDGLFGVPLHTLLENDQKRHPTCKVPLIFKQIITFLEQKGVRDEGILRVPGSAARIKNLRQDIEDKFPNGTFSWDDVRPNDVAALLKQLLRELPTPLLTIEYIEAFAQVETIPDKKQQLQALNLLVLLLPDVNRNCLLLLLKFLHKVVLNKKVNKMTLANVAMIIAPNLFMLQNSRGQKGSREIELNMAAGTSNIVKMLIRYHTILWTVPTFMLTQIRHQYESEQLKKAKDKSIMNLFTKKDKSDIYKKTGGSEGDFRDGVIRVQAPDLTKSSTAVQLNSKMTAEDIVAKFRRRNHETGVVHSGHAIYNASKKQFSGHGHSSLAGCANPMDVTFAEDTTYLYEVGGNIGERRLDHNTNMMSLYRINPGAEWVIKNVQDAL